MQRVIGCGFAAAMVSAPFLALLFDLAAGLAVMALALAATAYLAMDAARSAAPEMEKRLRVVAGVNGVLAAVCVVVLAILVV